MWLRKGYNGENFYVGIKNVQEKIPLDDYLTQFKKGKK